MDLGKDYELASNSSDESDLSGLCGDIDLDEMDEDGETGPKSYLKTQNEINPEEVEKVGPKFEQDKLDDLDEITKFGTAV